MPGPSLHCDGVLRVFTNFCLCLEEGKGLFKIFKCKTKEDSVKGRRKTIHLGHSLTHLKENVSSDHKLLDILQGAHNASDNSLPLYLRFLIPGRREWGRDTSQ